MSAFDAFSKSVQRVGLVGTLREIPRFVVHKITSSRANRAILRTEELDGFDRELGTDTSGIVEVFEMEGATEEQVDSFARYRAARPGTVRAAIEGLGVEYEKVTFVDVGCGKGRPLLIAATYPFKRVVGIEFSPELCRIAEGNLRVTAGRPDRRCADVSVVCADAREAALPGGDLVLFFYEPFTPPILEGFLEHLRRSLDEASRSVTVVSLPGGGARASLEPVFASTPWLRHLKVIDLDPASTTDPSSRRAFVYENVRT